MARNLDPSTTRIRSADRRWLAVAVLAVAQFMVFLDETVVNVALPSIKGDLGFSQSSLPWVVNAYIPVSVQSRRTERLRFPLASNALTRPR